MVLVGGVLNSASLSVRSASMCVRREVRSAHKLFFLRPDVLASAIDVRMRLRCLIAKTRNQQKVDRTILGVRVEIRGESYFRRSHIVLLVLRPRSLSP